MAQRTVHGITINERFLNNQQTISRQQMIDGLVGLPFVRILQDQITRGSPPPDLNLTTFLRALQRGETNGLVGFDSRHITTAARAAFDRDARTDVRAAFRAFLTAYMDQAQRSPSGVVAPDTTLVPGRVPPQMRGDTANVVERLLALRRDNRQEREALQTLLTGDAALRQRVVNEFVSAAGGIDAVRQYLARQRPGGRQITDVDARLARGDVETLMLLRGMPSARRPAPTEDRTVATHFSGSHLVRGHTVPRDTDRSRTARSRSVRAILEERMLTVSGTGRDHRARLDGLHSSA